MRPALTVSEKSGPESSLRFLVKNFKDQGGRREGSPEGSGLRGRGASPPPLDTGLCLPQALGQITTARIIHC